MKKLFAILFMSFTMTAAFGQTIFTVNGIKYTTTGTNMVQVSEGGTYIGEINIPSTVTYSGVFYLVTSIGKNAFYNCTGLTSVDIPSVSSIGSGAFLGCRGLKSVTIPSSVTSIGSFAFHSCTGLTSITIPSSVTSIENFTFYSCTGLTSVTIPSSVTSIGASAFENCSGLASVKIPSSVTSIRDYAFNGCNGLTYIIAYPATPVDLTSYTNVFGNVNNTFCILYVPPLSLSLYKSANQWMNFTNILSIPIATIMTTQLTNITTTTASGGGNITNDGGFTVIARGVCWSISLNPTIANSKTTDGTRTGAFSSNITGLNPGTTYHIRAYATNSAGTAYGNDLTFTTLKVIPTLNTNTASLITGTTATVGGEIISSGVASITSRGVCWNTTVNPTIANSKTTVGTGTGTFTSKITGLNPSTTYHVRAYAINSAGTAYGSDITFTTLASSTEVFLNNIAFISSAQDGAQSNVPSTMVMNSTNPYNFMNPGKTIRFKMQCFNKKSNGINIVSGSCKVRCNDPYFTLTDSTSGLNNVGWNASAWSTDEFEIQINNTTPWGYVGYVDFEVIEGSNSYFTYKVPIPVAPLSLQSKTVDDDNNPDSKGNGNGICEPNEIIESLPSLQNVSILSANSVYGLFNNYYGVSGVNVWNNKAGISGTVVNSGYWNYAFGAPQVITAGTKDMIPQWDFVFDYNFSSTYHFTMGLIMSGKFQLFSAYQSYIRWLVPIDYNIGYPDFNTGIRNKRIQELTVYPNPTYGKIIIVLDVDIMNEYTINLSNVLGQKVYSSQLNTEKLNLDLSNYCSKGIYFLQLLNNKGIIVGEKKIIFN